MLRSIELYISNIFVNPEVHNIFIKRIGFSLIRVHRQQIINADQSTAELLLQQLKWPIETLFVGMKMKDYNSSDESLRRQHLDKWHKFTKITPTTRTTQGWRSGKVTLKNSAYSLPANSFNFSASSTAQLRLTSTSAWSIGSNAFAGIASGDILTFTLNAANCTPDLLADATATATLVLTVSKVQPDGDVSTKGYIEFKETVGSVTASTGTTDIVVTTGTTIRVDAQSTAELSATVAVPTQTIDSITIKAHGIPIYNGFVSKFYNAYVPYHYGGPNVNVPKDKGALMIPFNLYPGTYQPSGHINVSRAREFYLEYTSSVISTSAVGTLYVTAQAINFLLISDGSAVLRYTT
jgi:hypothetical protein